MSSDTCACGLVSKEDECSYDCGDVRFGNKSHRKSLLTKREEVVLGLVRRGKSNLDIARALHISENTVRNHLKNVNEKLGSRSRSEAVFLHYGGMPDTGVPNITDLCERLLSAPRGTLSRDDVLDLLDTSKELARRLVEE